MATILACGGGSGGGGAEAANGRARETGYPLFTSPDSADYSSDPAARVFDGQLWVFTSHDQGYGGGAYYPMDGTYAHQYVASDWYWNDFNNTPVLSEADYSANGWWSYGSGGQHFWAPDVIKSNGLYYLFVPDLTNPDDVYSSRIGVSVAYSPSGPYTYQGTVGTWGGAGAYSSDPGPFQFGGKNYLVYADGNWDNCGGFRIATVENDWMTVDADQEVTINGLPASGVGSCWRGDRPTYVEGGSLDRIRLGNTVKFILYFAMQEGSDGNCGTYPSCTGQSGIGYATSDTVLGPYDYQGEIMYGNPSGEGEWTNQASLIRWEGQNVIFYHDGPANAPDADGNPQPTHHRKVHAACFTIGDDGKIQVVNKPDWAFANCGQFVPPYVGLWAMRTPQSGGSAGSPQYLDLQSNGTYFMTTYPFHTVCYAGGTYSLDQATPGIDSVGTLVLNQTVSMCAGGSWRWNPKVSTAWMTVTDNLAREGIITLDSATGSWLGPESALPYGY